MKKIILMMLVISMALLGCDDFLTEEPVLTQSSEITLSTYKGLNNVVAGAYSPLATGSWYGAFYVLDAEMRAGNATIPTNTDFTSGRMTLSRDMNYSSNATSGQWGYAYYVISAVNNVIDNLEGKDVGDVTAQDLSNLRAEALFLRALAHFDMVRLYAPAFSKEPDAPGVPIILHTDQSATEQPARNSVSEVYNQIITDLLEAESIIDPDYVRSGVSDSKAVATLPAIQALLSRVYLYSEQWQLAADYATNVIKNSDYNLWTATEYSDVWGKDVAGAGGEVIFEVYAAQANEYDEYWEGPAYMTNPDGYADCAAHQDLIGLYEAGDVRGTLFRTDADNASGSQWTTKYIGKQIAEPDLNNVIVLRLSEMYLNRAEAIINGATVAGVTALSDINAIRAKRGVAALSSVGADVIFKERRLELAFEGHLWFDYARTERASSISDRPDQSLAADSYKWALPIPQREIDVNKNLVQNFGY
ncbi:MAG: RagB/SusD family nutrient uptake outer membrane protein [Bacteroidales bacterium]